MNLKQIVDEALHLSEEERAELAQKLLLSLDAPTMEEIEEDWLAVKHTVEPKSLMKVLCCPFRQKRSEEKPRPC